MCKAWVVAFKLYNALMLAFYFAVSSFIFLYFVFRLSYFYHNENKKRYKIYFLRVIRDLSAKYDLCGVICGIEWII